MNKKILITGGCGFLGSNLSRHAIESGYELHILDNLYREGSKENLHWLQKQGPFTYHHKDIRNQNDVETVVREVQPDITFHLAGQVAMTTSIEQPQFDFEINVRGSFNILEAIRKYAPESITIYSSTNKVYGDFAGFQFNEEEKRYSCPEYPEGFPESLPLDFHSPYGCSKGAADQYMLDYSRVYNLRTVVFRHSSIYGGRQFSTEHQGWIGWFCRKALEMQDNPESQFTIAGDGKQVRDVLHAEDLIRCYFSAVNNIGSAKGQAFNIGGGMKNSFSLLELFAFLEDELNVTMNFKKTPWRFSDQKVFVADNSKAGEILGWTPAVDKNCGVRKMIEWMKSIKENFK